MKAKCPKCNEMNEDGASVNSETFYYECCGEAYSIKTLVCCGCGIRTDINEMFSVDACSEECQDKLDVV